MATNEFQIGDEVCLKNNKDLSMMVNGINGDSVECVWQVGKQQKTSVYNYKILEYYTPKQGLQAFASHYG